MSEFGEDLCFRSARFVINIDDIVMDMMDASVCDSSSLLCLWLPSCLNAATSDTCVSAIAVDVVAI